MTKQHLAKIQMEACKQASQVNDRSMLNQRIVELQQMGVCKQTQSTFFHGSWGFAMVFHKSFQHYFNKSTVLAIATQSPEAWFYLKHYHSTLQVFI